MNVTTKVVNFKSPEAFLFYRLVEKQWKEQTLSNIMRLPIHKLIVAVTYQDVIGGVMICLTQNAHYCLPYFLVQKDVRGKGVGSQLMASCKTFCKNEYDEMDVHLVTERRNVKSRRFYQRHDFKLLEEIPGYYDDEEDGYGCHYIFRSTSSVAQLKRALHYTGLQFP